MANLSNINNKLLVGTNGEVRIGDTATVADVKLRIKQLDNQWPMQIVSNYAYGLSIDTSLGTDGNAGSLQIYPNSGGGFIVRNDSRVGIGTATPQKKVHIEGTGGASEMQILVSSASDTVGHTAGIGLRGEGGESDGDLRIKGGIFFERIAGSFGNGKMILAVNSSVNNASVTVADHALTIDTNKNVGIGTDSPTNILQIHQSDASSNAYLHITHQDGGSAATDGISIGLESDGVNAAIRNRENGYLRMFTNNTERMRIDSSGNMTLLNATATNSRTIGITNSSGTTGWTFGNGVLSNTHQFVIYDNTAGSSRMLINSSGNFGIGTTSPQGKLDSVAPAADLTDFGRATGSALNIRIANVINRLGQINFCNDAAPAFGYGSIGMVMTSGSGVGLGDMVFGTKSSGSAVVSTERMRITSGGDTQLSGNNLDIKGTSAGNTSIRITDSTGTIGTDSLDLINDGTAAYIWNRASTPIRFGTGGTERMRITSGGNIDTNSHSGSAVAYGFRLAAQSGYSQIYMESTSTDTRTLQRFYNPNGNVGNIIISGFTTSYDTSSDYRLKEDLQDFAGLDMVSKIPVYDFKWKTDESRSYGVMAHELQEVLPDAVSGEKDAEEMQGVDYSKIVPTLIKAIQELKADNDSLKARIETLENN